MTSSSPDAPRRSPAGLIAAIIFIVVAAALGGAWLLRSPAAASVGAGSGDATASSSDQEGVSILLGLADTALAEHRLVAPEGANAFEFYLSVLQLDPANALAHAHLEEAFPQALAEVEQTINAQSLDEAARELRLLREVDADNYTLSLLTGKLDAQRVIKTREDEARAAILQARAAGTAKP